MIHFKKCRTSIVLATLLTTAFNPACKTTKSNSSKQLASEADRNNRQEPQVLHQINKDFKAGESFTLPLDPNRVVDQITVKYDGHYTLTIKDKDGNLMRNDEGAPYYKDGMYA